MIEIAAVALGSNDHPELNLPRAIDALAGLGEIVSVSTVYQTPAIGAPDQPDYLNAICQLRTALPPPELRARLKEIERAAGRRRDGQPVSLDLDLSLLGNRRVDHDGITVPHPDLLERPALARAMAELDPTGRHPITGETFAAIAARLGGDPPPRPRPDVDLGRGGHR